MMSMRANLLVAALLLVPGVAAADRGALSVEAGGGVTAINLTAPFSDAPPPLTSMTPVARAGVTYALTNRLELAANGFFEPPVTVFHNDVTVVRDTGRFPGTLKHSVSRYGATVGARVLFGLVYRMSAGVEVGFSRRSYSALTHIDDANPAAPLDYNLALQDFSTTNLVVAPTLGFTWAGGDHWSLSFLPRVELLLGADPVVGFSLPLVASWSWYL